MDLPTREFYDRFANDYHVIFGSWEEEVRRQGKVLDKLLRSETGQGRLSILDCSCGIGTQAIGLALRSHRLTATDLSPCSVKRAKEEAERFGVEIAFGVADFRSLEGVEGTFDAVISCDNALPHMMSQEDLLSAARSTRSKVCEGGLFLASIRGYDELLKDRPGATMPKVMDTTEERRVYFQVWDWEDDGRIYTGNLFLVGEENGRWQTLCTTRPSTGRFHAKNYRRYLRKSVSLRSAGRCLRRATTTNRSSSQGARGLSRDEHLRNGERNQRTLVGNELAAKTENAWWMSARRSCSQLFGLV